jgi:hypothetical protein
MMGEMPEEWKNCIIIHIYKKGDKQKAENYRGISQLKACYKVYSKVLNENLKTHTENFRLECQNGFQRGRSCIDPLFSMKLLVEKRREFNLETHLAFIDYVNALDKVERDKLFEILQSKVFPIYY